MRTFLALMLAFALVPRAVAAEPSTQSSPLLPEANQWRTEHRLIDMHLHVGFAPAQLDRAVRIMDAVGIGTAVSLGSGVVTPGKDGAASEFERNKRLADEQ